MGFPGGSTVKNLPAMQETQFWPLGQEGPLEKGMATHCSILAWRIPRTAVPSRLQSMGSQRVRHNWATHTHTHRHTHTHTPLWRPTLGPFNYINHSIPLLFKKRIEIFSHLQPIDLWLVCPWPDFFFSCLESVLFKIGQTLDYITNEIWNLSYLTQ